MDAGDIRALLLIGSLLVGRALRMPLIIMATATAVMFWHGYETGARTTLRGLLTGEDLVTLALLAFILVLAGVVWGLMVRELRRGRIPPVKPSHVVVATLFIFVGLAAGLLGSAAFGRVMK